MNDNEIKMKLYAAADKYYSLYQSQHNYELRSHLHNMYTAYLNLISLECSKR